MENCNFILKAINEKIADQEGMINFYREEISKKDDIIRELIENVAKLEVEINADSKTIEGLKIENKALKEANEELRKKLNAF